MKQTQDITQAQVLMGILITAALVSTNLGMVLDSSTFYIIGGLLAIETLFALLLAYYLLGREEKTSKIRNWRSFKVN